MKFSDLKAFVNEFDIIPPDILLRKHINAPLNILRQFYSDHGAKEEFHDQYADIDLSKIKWSKQSCSAKKIFAVHVMLIFKIGLRGLLTELINSNLRDGSV